MACLVKGGEDTSGEHSLKTTDRVKGAEILSQALLSDRWLGKSHFASLLLFSHLQTCRANPEVFLAQKLYESLKNTK